MTFPKRSAQLSGCILYCAQAQKESDKHKHVHCDQSLLTCLFYGANILTTGMLQIINLPNAANSTEVVALRGMNWWQKYFLVPIEKNRCSKKEADTPCSMDTVVNSQTLFVVYTNRYVLSPMNP
jgi:hypothetical protein